MNKKTIFLLLLITVSCCFSVDAQKFDPMAIRVTNNGQEIVEPEPADTVKLSGELVGSAPMTVRFMANIEVPEGYKYFCEWYFTQNTNVKPTLFRTEDNWDYTFEESGAFYYKLLVTYTKEDDETTTEEESDFFAIKISESELKVPNAFSPNGDGVNDVFHVTYKSLVKFNAYVFNRWGQELYHWGLGNIDEGWDGTAHGKPVKDGVYFIVIEAEGSDGIKYKHKGDINILRGYSGTGSVGNASQQ